MDQEPWFEHVEGVVDGPTVQLLPTDALVLDIKVWPSGRANQH